MPNPNVDALYSLLLGIDLEHIDKPGSFPSTMEIAEKLASNGVLVISDAVLTDEVVDKANQDGDVVDASFNEGSSYAMLKRPALIAWLSRLAKGE